MFFQTTSDSDVPVLKPTSFALGLNFATPLPFLKWFQAPHSYEALDEGEEEVDESSTAVETADESENLRIHAAVGGRFKPMAHAVAMVDEETGEEETQMVSKPFNVCLGLYSN